MGTLRLKSFWCVEPNEPEVLTLNIYGIAIDNSDTSRNRRAEYTGSDSEIGPGWHMRRDVSGDPEYAEGQ